MGGAEGQLTPEDSAQALLKLIGGLSEADSGHFFDWQGQAVAW